MGPGGQRSKIHCSWGHKAAQEATAFTSLISIVVCGKGRACIHRHSLGMSSLTCVQDESIQPTSGTRCLNPSSCCSNGFKALKVTWDICDLASGCSFTNGRRGGCCTFRGSVESLHSGDTLKGLQVRLQSFFNALGLRVLFLAPDCMPFALVCCKNQYTTNTGCYIPESIHNQKCVITQHTGSLHSTEFETHQDVPSLGRNSCSHSFACSGCSASDGYHLALHGRHLLDVLFIVYVCYFRNLERHAAGCSCTKHGFAGQC